MLCMFLGTQLPYATKALMYIYVYVYTLPIGSETKDLLRSWLKKTFFSFFVKIMFAHYVRRQLGFGQTWVNFVRPMSDDQLLFAALLYGFNVNDLRSYIILLETVANEWIAWKIQAWTGLAPWPIIRSSNEISLIKMHISPIKTYRTVLCLSSEPVPRDVIIAASWYKISHDLLTATSDGTQSHLNDASGGHCNDTENNVYMKIEVYVCEKGNQTATGRVIHIMMLTQPVSVFMS